MATQTGRESDKFMLRLPDGMRERIRIEAELNGRSMNAEIVATLEKAYPSPPKLTREQRYALAAEFVRELESLDPESLDKDEIDQLKMLRWIRDRNSPDQK